MTRLTPPAEPATAEVSPAIEDAPPPKPFGRPRVVDVSADSLSTFSSEQELAVGRNADVAAVPRAPVKTSLAAHLLIPVLVGLVVGQAALIGWWWWASGGAWPQRQAATAAFAVTSEPPGVPVVIDGVSRGTTPLEVQLDGGQHDLAVGDEPTPWTQTLVVQPGVASTVHVVRTPTPVTVQPPEAGTLEITTEPTGLAVAIDGRPRGVSPISITDLQPGKHEVAVTRGTSVVRRTVSVEAGVPTAVLISTTNAGIASGWLTVTAPVPVQIVENGTLVGSSEAPRVLMPVGRHDLEFSNAAFGYRARRTVQVTAGQAATIALESATGTLSVNAQPWGEVWIDGRRIGETPIGNLQLPIGNHEVVVRHPQLGEHRRTVPVTVNAPARVGIDLRQR